MTKPKADRIVPVITDKGFAGFRVYFANLDNSEGISTALAPLTRITYCFEPTAKSVRVMTDNRVTAVALQQLFTPTFLYTASVEYKVKSAVTPYPVIYLTFYGTAGYGELQRIGARLQRDISPTTDVRIRQSGDVYILELNGPHVGTFYTDGGKFRSTLRDMLIAIP